MLFDQPFFGCVCIFDVCLLHSFCRLSSCFCSSTFAALAFYLFAASFAVVECKHVSYTAWAWVVCEKFTGSEHHAWSIFWLPLKLTSPVRVVATIANLHLEPLKTSTWNHRKKNNSQKRKEIIPCNSQNNSAPLLCTATLHWNVFCWRDLRMTYLILFVTSTEVKMWWSPFWKNTTWILGLTGDMGIYVNSGFCSSIFSMLLIALCCDQIFVTMKLATTQDLICRAHQVCEDSDVIDLQIALLEIGAPGRLRILCRPETGDGFFGAQLHGCFWQSRCDGRWLLLMEEILHLG